MILSEQHPCSTESSLIYRIADSWDDREAAFQLVYHSYFRAGLGVSNPFEMRVTPFQLCDTSQIFVALHEVKVVSTVTLVGDGPLGLPMETMFAGEIDQLRSEGRQLAEVSCLADRREEPRRFLETFIQLTRLMAQFSRYQGTHNLLISVHPRHARFYARYFGFRAISDRIAQCPHVQDRPAVGLNLDFELFDREQPKCWHDFFGTWLSQEELQPCRIPEGERNFLKEIALASCGAPEGHSNRDKEFAHSGELAPA